MQHLSHTVKSLTGLKYLLDSQFSFFLFVIFDVIRTPPRPPLSPLRSRPMTDCLFVPEMYMLFRSDCSDITLYTMTSKRIAFS